MNPIQSQVLHFLPTIRDIAPEVAHEQACPKRLSLDCVIQGRGDKKFYVAVFDLQRVQIRKCKDRNRSLRLKADEQRDLIRPALGLKSLVVSYKKERITRVIRYKLLFPTFLFANQIVSGLNLLGFFFS